MLDLIKESFEKKIDGPIRSIEVIGGGIGCSACSILYENVKKAVEELELDVDHRYTDDAKRALEYTSFFTPILLINGEVVSKGKVYSVDKLKTILCSAEKE